jgi:hypothetical protein
MSVRPPTLRLLLSLRLPLSALNLLVYAVLSY